MSVCVCARERERVCVRVLYVSVSVFERERENDRVGRGGVSSVRRYIQRVAPSAPECRKGLIPSSTLAWTAPLHGGDL